VCQVGLRIIVGNAYVAGLSDRNGHAYRFVGSSTMFEDERKDN